MLMITSNLRQAVPGEAALVQLPAKTGIESILQ